MTLISIVGAGRVGSTTAFMLAMKDLADIMLVDIVEKVPQGEAMDIMHAAASGFSANVEGSNDFSKMAGSDIVINTAGMARRPGMDRLDLLNRNIQIVRSVAASIKKHAPDAIIIQVSNPMDALNYAMRKAGGFQRERVIGMGGMLDSQRFSLFLAQELNRNYSGQKAGESVVRPADVKAMVIGEHGESQVPLFSQSFLKGECVADMLDKRQMQKLVGMTRAAGSEIIALKGATFFAPAIAITRMVENVLGDRKDVMPCSICLESEYGQDGLSIGVPARLCREGLDEVVDLDINEEERSMFDMSARKMKNVIEEVGL